MRPTKPRIALLQAIADGEVTRHYPILPDVPYDVWWGKGRRQTVTGRVFDLEASGYVRLLPRPEGSHYKESRTWSVTPAGRMFLDANGAS